MRALFITRKFLGDGEAPVMGVYQRLRMFTEAVSQIATHLDLLAMVPHDFVIDDDAVREYRAMYEHWIHCPFTLTLVPRNPPQGARSLAGYFRRPWDITSPAVHPYYLTSGTPQIDAIRRALAAGPDFVFVHRLFAMSPILRGGLTHPAMFFDLDDIEHITHLRNTFAPPRWGSKYLELLHTPALLLAERRAVAASRMTFVCSDTDRRYLERLFRVDQIATVPNAVDIPPASPVPAAPTLLFLGNAMMPANKAAAEWLIGQVWPAVRAAVPAARLLVAGQYPELIDAFAAPPDGVEFLGLVDDLAALYAGVRVVTCPILSGGGTRFKIIEAGAYGRPIVSTRVGAEGLALEDDASILLRDAPADFAQACIDLLLDQARCDRLAAAARSVVAGTYERGSVIGQIRERILGALSRPPLRASA